MKPKDKILIAQIFVAACQSKTVYYHSNQQTLGLKLPGILAGNGLCIAWLSILLMLPIPLTNPFSTIAILLLAVATIESDGLLMCVDYFLSLANTAFFGIIGYIFEQLPHILLDFLR